MSTPVLDRALVRASTRPWWLGYAAILFVAGLVRYINIGTDPGYELDEAVYTRVAANLAEGLGMHTTPEWNATASPYLSHPPFHFLLLAGWDLLTGVHTVTSARVFAATCSMIFLAVTGLIVRKYFGDKVALITMAALAFNAWIVFQNRIAWLENPQIILFALLLGAFWRAERNNTAANWALAGAALGACIMYKHTGAAWGFGFALAMLMNYRQTPNFLRNAFAAFASCVIVVGVYFLTMWAVFGDSFLGQSLSQFDRTTGTQASPGVLKFSPTFLHTAITTPYWLFVGTALITAAAWILGLARTYRVLRKRDTWGDMELLWGMTVGVTIALGIMQLRFPHYFIMLFIPAAMYFAAEVSRLRWRAWLPTALAVLMVLNIGGVTWRLAWNPDNALQNTAAWIEDHKRPGDVFVGEQSLGNLVGDIPYCRSIDARCASEATLVETYRSYTQNLPENDVFKALLKNATECVTYSGLRETITVYAVPPRTCA